MYGPGYDALMSNAAPAASFVDVSAETMRRNKPLVLVALATLGLVFWIGTH